MRSQALALLAAGLLLATAAVPVLAKEGVEARLDAPIGMDTPGGTELLVGMTVTAPDGDTTVPVVGTPMYLRLTGRDGSSTRAAGAVEGKPGHYVMRIEVPAGGARAVEIGIHGTSDLPVIVAGEVLVFGGVTASTAQVAPAPVPALTPFPRASAVAPAVIAPVVAGEAPVSSVVEPTAPGPLVAGLLALAVVLGLGLLVLARRSRRPPPTILPDQAPGG